MNDIHVHLAANLFLSHQPSLMIPAPHTVILLFATPLLPFCPGRIPFAALKLAHELSKAGAEIYGLSVCGLNDMLLAGITTTTLTGAAMRMGGAE